jgi:hypothetical protein
MDNHDVADFHARIHNGTAFLANDWVAISGAGTRELLIVPPDWSECHMNATFSANGEFTVTVYEGTAKTGGTGLTCYNRKRKSGKTAQTSIAHTPSGSGNGTQLFKFTGGSSGIPANSQVGGAFGTYAELVLKNRSDYLIVIAGTDVDVTSIFNFYEIWEPDGVTTTSTTTTTTTSTTTTTTTT